MTTENDTTFENFEKLGGKLMLEKVAKIFYDKVYEHEWIGKIFLEVSQDIIESQQVDFIAAALGGPKNYCGKLPIPVHKNMFITEDLFELRKQLLTTSLKEANASEELIERWLKIDDAFKPGIVKKKLSDCEKKFFTDEILEFPQPSNMKKAA